MNMLKKALLWLLVILVLLVALGFILPSRIEIQSDILIQASPEKIQPYLANMRKWELWTPWGKHVDPTVVNTYFGPEDDTATTLEWKGDKLGQGTIALTGSSPINGITYVTSFNHNSMKSIGAIQYELVPEGTRVIWNDRLDVGENPLRRYFQPILYWLLKRDFHKGLVNLKRIVENK